MEDFKDLLEFDDMQMYFCDDYKITDDIVLKSPTIGDIIEFGEKKYYSIVYSLTCIPSDMKSQLFDKGIDWNKIEDFNLFILLTRGMTAEDTKLTFDNLDLSSFEIAQNTKTGEAYLYKTKEDGTEIVIDSLVYEQIVGYLRKLHGIVPKKERAFDKYTKEILIDEDRHKIELNKKKPYKSQLMGLISAMSRFPGFPYKRGELKECGLYEFMDRVHGAQIFISTTALLGGMYSGMIDTSKINKNEFNWMRSLD